MKITRLHGPAGSGKTTRLLEYVKEWIDAGVDPETTAFVSFSKAAIKEARERVGLTPNQIPHWKTIHATAFKALSLNPKRVLWHPDWKEFGDQRNLSFLSSTSSRNAMLTPHTDGDQLALSYHYARATMSEDWDAVAEGSGFTGNPEEIGAFSRALAEFKEAKEKVDFADMLSDAIEQEAAPEGLTHLIVDEGQDCSPVQIKYLQLIIERNPTLQRVILAGDAAQSVYSFMGCSPELFLGFDVTDEEFLRFSHRLPDQIVRFARRIYPDVSAFEGYYSTDNHIEPRAQLDRILKSLNGASTYVLTRTNYLLTSLCKTLSNHGIDYLTKKEDDQEEVFRRCVGHMYSALQQNEYTLTADEFVSLVALMRSSRGGILPHGYKKKAAVMGQYSERGINICKEPWFKDWQRFVKAGDPAIVFFGKWSAKLPRYLRIIEEKGPQALLEDPAVVVLTMHGSKGKEADQVIVVPALSRRIWDGLDAIQPRIRDTAQAAEARLMYVACTRAHKRLVLLDSYDGFCAPHKCYSYPEVPEAEECVL